MIDPLTLLPLDTETIWASLRKTGRLVIVHEDTLTGGWGAEVAARAAEECLFDLEAPIRRIASYRRPDALGAVPRGRRRPLRGADQGRDPGAARLMARPVRMPPLGATSDELRIVQWLKEVGAAVEQGEMLLEVETDKATLEVEAAVSGTLLAVLHGPGETVTVGEVLAFVGAPGEEVPLAVRAARRRRSRPCRSPAGSRRSTGSTWLPSTAAGPAGRDREAGRARADRAAPAAGGRDRGVAPPARRGGAPDAVGADDPPVQRRRRRRHERRRRAARARAARAASQASPTRTCCCGRRPPRCASTPR